jgi:hypothetical protein
MPAQTMIDPIGNLTHSAAPATGSKKGSDRGFQKLRSDPGYYSPKAT